MVVRIGFLALVIGAAACSKKGTCDGKDLVIEVSGNHGHSERIPAAKLTELPHKLRLEGGSHEHGFLLSDADIEKLKSGGTVTLRSSSMNAHVHELGLTCAK